MGCWKLPFNDTAVNKLEKLMSMPLSYGEQLNKQLYNIYGDDDFFDELDAKINSKADARKTIAKHIGLLLTDLENDPSTFKSKVPQALKNRLKKAIKF